MDIDYLKQNLLELIPVIATTLQLILTDAIHSDPLSQFIDYLARFEERSCYRFIQTHLEYYTVKDNAVSQCFSRYLIYYEEAQKDKNKDPQKFLIDQLKLVQASLNSMGPQIPAPWPKLQKNRRL